MHDPSIVQSTCADCGLPIRSESFGLSAIEHRFEQPTDNGVETRFVTGELSPIKRQVNEWRHDDPRVSDHPFKGHRATPLENTSHDADYERQERAWRMNEMEKRHHLGQQFKGEN